MASETVEYYRNLLVERPWYAEGLSWTVIRPAGAAVTVDEVMRRLRAEPVTVDDATGPFLVAHLRQVGSDVVMVQGNGSEGSRREVLRWLSDRARVYNVDWTINGNGSITYAVYGSVLTWIDKNNPDRRHGTHPDALDDALADLREARRCRDAEEWPATRLASEAAALATVESSTRIRLEAEWVDDLTGPQWTTVLLDRIPPDPRAPGHFGIDDPDLDARLRGAPEAVWRKAVAAGLRRLLAAFTVSDEALATAVIGAVERGEPADRDLQTGAFRLAATPRPGGRFIGPAFHEAIKAPHGDPINSLSSVRAALDNEWPAFRRSLLADLQDLGALTGRAR